jgi:hypothetical protein
VRRPYERGAEVSHDGGGSSASRPRTRLGFLVYGNGEESAFLFRMQAVHGEAQFIEGDLIYMRWRRSLIGHGIGKKRRLRMLVIK